MRAALIWYDTVRRRTIHAEGMHGLIFKLAPRTSSAYHSFEHLLRDASYQITYQSIGAGSPLPKATFESNWSQ